MNTSSHAGRRRPSLPRCTRAAASIRDASLVACALGITLTVHAGPIMWEQPVQELRAEAGASSVAAVFRFRNDGDAPVTFGRIAPTCGCTVGQLERQTWQPGETGELTAHFHVGGYEGRKSVGIQVSYESPKSSPDSLTLTVEVRPWYELKPRLLWWRRGTTPEARSIAVKFADAHRDARVELSGDEPGGFRVALQPGADGQVTLAIAPESTGEALSRQLHLRLVRPDGRTAEHVIHLRVM